MSQVKIQGNASGTGIFTIASPNSNSNQTLTLPDETGTFLTSGGALSGTTGSFSGNLSFNSGYGSAAVAYGCRAWVNFNGTANSNLAGTYARSGTTVTVTATNHGQAVGNVVNLDFTTGTAADGIFTVVTVPDANTFTVTHGTSGTTSGNVSIIRSTIRASGGVASVTDAGAGFYYINFSVPMPDANYSVVGAASGDNSGSSNPPTLSPQTNASAAYLAQTTGAVPIFVSQSKTALDVQGVNVAVFR
jgi:hypothetical protein